MTYALYHRTAVTYYYALMPLALANNVRLDIYGVLFILVHADGYAHAVRHFVAQKQQCLFAYYLAHDVPHGLVRDVAFGVVHHFVFQLPCQLVAQKVYIVAAYAGHGYYILYRMPPVRVLGKRSERGKYGIYLFVTRYIRFVYDDVHRNRAFQSALYHLVIAAAERTAAVYHDDECVRIARGRVRLAAHVFPKLRARFEQTGGVHEYHLILARRQYRPHRVARGLRFWRYYGYFFAR